MKISKLDWGIIGVTVGGAACSVLGLLFGNKKEENYEKTLLSKVQKGLIRDIPKEEEAEPATAEENAE